MQQSRVNIGWSLRAAPKAATFDVVDRRLHEDFLATADLEFAISAVTVAVLVLVVVATAGASDAEPLVADR